MLKTPPSTRLDLLRPSIHNRVLRKQGGDKERRDQRAVERSFMAGDSVWATNFLGQPKWVAAVIENRLGPLTFVLRLQDNRVWKRRQDHLRERRPTGSTEERRAGINDGLFRKRSSFSDSLACTHTRTHARTHARTHTHIHAQFR